MPTIHIGKKIREVLSQKAISIVEFADKINKTRTVVYDIFKRDSIDSLLLSKISRVLEHDFFTYYNPERIENNKTFKEKESSYLKKKDQVIVLQLELEEAKRKLTEIQKQNELLMRFLNLAESAKEKRRK